MTFRASTWPFVNHGPDGRRYPNEIVVRELPDRLSAEVARALDG